MNNTKFLNNSFFENYFKIFENYLKIICEIQDDGANEIQSDQIKLSILKYVYPIILVFGILGNIVSLTVMIKIYIKKRGLYGFTLNLAALSLADLAVLIFGCFREYSDVILEWRLRSMNLFMCKFFYFNCYFFSCFSAYLHSYIAYERWYAVSSPLKFKIKPLKNKLLISFTLIFSFLISCPYIYFAEIKSFVAVNEKNSFDVKILNECEATQDHFLLDLILATSDSLFYCIVPFLLSFVFSMISLFSLCFKNVNGVSKRPNNEFLRMISLDESTNVIIDDHIGLENKKRHNNNLTLAYKRAKMLNRQVSTVNPSSNIKLTIMFLAIPISYLITALPIFIIILLQFFFIGDRVNNNESELAVAKMLMYINCSINILFYIFLGKSLRNDFLDILSLRFLRFKS